jgi:antitoxin component of MazEF toxin-antitoxin module
MRTLTVYLKRTNGTRQPHIRLTGQWLERAGFKPGDKITVLVENRQITIQQKMTPRQNQ